MENAADALKIGAWVLILVVALSLTMSAFSQARQTIDAQLNATDREYLSTYIPESGDTDRIVGMEAIIPTISRAFQENFTVRFKFKDSYYLYKDEDVSGNYVYGIDLDAKKIISADREKFVEYLLYGKTTENNTTKDNEFKQKCLNTYRITFNATPLYNKLRYARFKEKLGVYYQDETEGGNKGAKENKSARRVITYEEI